jgi:ArsR family transcriptional regulator
MKTSVQGKFRAQARILKALAHETRLAIVSRLADGACTVGELVSMTGGNQSTVSKHLTVLKSVGIVDDERKGRTVEYRLVIPCVVEFLTCAIKVVQERKKTASPDWMAL